PPWPRDGPARPRTQRPRPGGQGGGGPGVSRAGRRELAGLRPAAPGRGGPGPRGGRPRRRRADRPGLGHEPRAPPRPDHSRVGALLDEEVRRGGLALRERLARRPARGSRPRRPRRGPPRAAALRRGGGIAPAGAGARPDDRERAQQPGRRLRPHRAAAAGGRGVRHRRPSHPDPGHPREPRASARRGGPVTAVTAVGATAPAATLRRPAVYPGQPFVGFTFDYLVIGGGFSLLVLALLASGTMPSASVFLKEHLWTFVLLSNSAHFAGSTVRLYTRPGSFRDLPFLTMGLPLVSLVVLALGLVFPGALGQNLLSLYLTWSPYHYSAQAYGIAVLYCYRSGAPWDEKEKRWLRLACFAPFLYSFLTIPGAGLTWLMPAAALADPAAAAVRGFAATAAMVASFAAPLALFVRHQVSGRARLPLISLLAVLANAVWLVLL